MNYNDIDNTNETPTKEEKKILLELICNEQAHTIIKNHMKYNSDKYKKLEKLKVKIKDF